MPISILSPSISKCDAAASGLGNAYAILAIVSSVVSGLVVSAEAGGGFNIGTIVGLVYPVLTLALLNTTFKEDFIR